MYDPLIYGKNELERVVSIEVENDKTIAFIENEDGTINQEELPNRFWILSPKPIGEGWAKLEGNLYYQFGKQYIDREEYLRARSKYYPYDTFSIYNAKEAMMVKDGLTYFKGMKHGEASILAFDIESTGLEHNDAAKTLLIANTYRKNGKIIRKLFSYSDFKSEAEFLASWCNWVREINPSIICGHNIFIYDFPYLEFCARRAGIELNLGRNGSAITFDSYESKFRKDSSQFYHYHKVGIYGRELIDTMFLAVKYDVGRKYESYALKSIIAAEGLEVKDRTFYDASKIRYTYQDPEEWKKICAYAINDGDDALALYDLMSPPFFYLTQSVAKPYQMMMESASGSQINTVMMRSYLQEGHSLPKASQAIDYEGGIAFGNPGIWRNVFKVDVASLYPNIMIQYEVYDPEKDPNGHFLELVKIFTERRLKNKKLAKDTGDKYYEDLQAAEKIFINSCYGFLGTNGLLFNSPKNAAFVTAQGRAILQEAINWAEYNDLKVVNADTDSISVCYSDMKEVEDTERIAMLIDLNHGYPEKIRFEDDGYFETFIVVGGKNYVLYDGKTIKYKGSALKASTKEPRLKQFIKDIFEAIIYKKENYTEIYHRYVDEILNIEDMKPWACRKTITDKVLNGERTNETKVKDAIEGTEYREGDRAYFYFKSDDSLGLIEKFDGDYNEDKLFEKLWKTSQICDTILNTKELFPNYKLKRNKKLLEENVLKASVSDWNKEKLHA